MSLFSFVRDLFGSTKKLFSNKNTSPPPAKWNDLPDLIILQIALKLEISDLFRMGGVCRWWHTVINQSEHTRRCFQQRSEMPWLFLEHSPSTDLIHLYSLSQGKRFSFLKPKFMRESFCCGTTDGWLIMVYATRFNHLMFLWNPLSAQIITLPPFSTIPCYIRSRKAGVFKRRTISSFIERVQVFNVSGHVVVAAILGLRPPFGGCGQNLVLCTPEDAEWTTIEEDRDFVFYFDILHHNGMLYVVQGDLSNEQQSVEEGHKRGIIEAHTVSLDYNCEVRLGIIYANPYCKRDVFKGDHERERFFPMDVNLEVVRPFGKLVGWLHLAESSNSAELLLITRTCVLFAFHRRVQVRNTYHPSHNETRDFKVEIIKFENDKSIYTLSSCNSLNNRALFVGSCGALCFDSELYQDCVWFLPSKLYIYNALQSKDAGVFSLRDKSIKRCFPSTMAPLASSLGWFTPKLL